MTGYSFDPSRRTTEVATLKYSDASGAVLWGPVLHQAGRSNAAVALARLGSDVVVATVDYKGLLDGPVTATLVRYTEGLGLLTQPWEIPPASCGYPYGKGLVLANASGPAFFSIVSGSLPAGIILSSDGTLSGSPTSEGGFDSRVRAADGAAAVERDYHMSVFPARRRCSWFDRRPPGSPRPPSRARPSSARAPPPPSPPARPPGTCGRPARRRGPSR